MPKDNRFICAQGRRGGLKHRGLFFGAFGIGRKRAVVAIIGALGKSEAGAIKHDDAVAIILMAKVFTCFMLFLFT